MKSTVRQIENQNKPLKPEQAAGDDLVDILVFLIPCLRFVQLKVVGVLSGSDLLISVVFLYLLFRRRIRIATPVGKWLMVLCSLWLASQCVTDIVRHSAFMDYARGWSNIGMTIAYLAVLWTLLYGKPRRIVLYGWGLVLGSILTFFISPDDLMTDYPWKFGLSLPVTLAVFLLASRKDCRDSWPVTMSAVIGVINFGLGARGVGGFCLVTALYLQVIRVMRRRGMAGRKLNARSVMTVAGSIIIGFACILWVYQFAARRGILGEDARSKYEAESSGKYGILLGGRTEMLGYLPAIYDSPILGHGSWAKDPTYLIAEREALAMMGYTISDELSTDLMEDAMIPTHSYIFGAWVDAGILGALFWGWIWVLTARILMQVHPPSLVMLPLLTFAAFSLLWDVLFSPYGAQMRIISPYYIVLILTYWPLTPYKVAEGAVNIAKQRPAHAGG